VSCRIRSRFTGDTSLQQCGSSPLRPSRAGHPPGLPLAVALISLSVRSELRAPFFRISRKTATTPACALAKTEPIEEAPRSSARYRNRPGKDNTLAYSDRSLHLRIPTRCATQREWLSRNHYPLCNPALFAYRAESQAPSGRRLPVSRLNFLPQGSPGTIYPAPPRLAQQIPG